MVLGPKNSGSRAEYGGIPETFFCKILLFRWSFWALGVTMRWDMAVAKDGWVLSVGPTTLGSKLGTSEFWKLPHEDQVSA